MKGLQKWFLVLDDEDEVEFFTIAVRETGLPVTLEFLTNCSSVLECLRQSRPDMVLLDTFLPNFNSIECLNQIRHEDAFNDLPVVILSTQSNEVEKQDIFEKGAHRLAIKPNNMSAYAIMVRDLWETVHHKQKVSKDNFEMNYLS